MELAALVAEFSALKNQQPSRLRYPTVYVKEERRHKSSFQGEVIIPIEQLQTRLQELVDEPFGDDDFNKPSDSLGRELADVVHGQSQELYSLGAY